MEFTPHTEADFLKQEYFVQWVLSPTKESSEYWQRWLNQNPDKVELLGAARDLLLSFEPKETHAMDDVSYYKILDNLLEENSKQKAQTANGKMNTSKPWFIAAAASIILFSSLSLIGLLGSKKENPVAKLKLIDYNIESVPDGFKKSITLPDGSVVKLNSASELKYPSQFTDTLREVYLTGQAFFEVTKNPKAPFIVHTKHFSTHVLGTSFDIQCYDNESLNHVAVVTGKVQVTTSVGDEEVLTPKNMSTYNVDKKSLSKTKFDPAVLLAWRDGILSFDHADFKEVVTTLSRWYGVRVEVEEGFEVKGFYTGRFEKEALLTVLKGISYSSHFSYKVEDKTVLITKP
ncbi:MAG TPA: FecR domain-containing protein [Cyclobacteriaceae bacterium]